MTGALVALEQGSNIIVTTETDSNGAYELEAVAAGTYTIATGGPTGLAPTQSITVGTSNVTISPLELGTAQSRARSSILRTTPYRERTCSW